MARSRIAVSRIFALAALLTVLTVCGCSHSPKADDGPKYTAQQLKDLYASHRPQGNAGPPAPKR